MTKAEKEGLLAQLTSLADFVKHAEEYEDTCHRDMRLYMTKQAYEELTKECGHEVDIVGGIRLEPTEEELE